MSRAKNLCWSIAVFCSSSGDLSGVFLDIVSNGGWVVKLKKEDLAFGILSQDMLFKLECQQFASNFFWAKCIHSDFLSARFSQMVFLQVIGESLSSRGSADIIYLFCPQSSICLFIYCHSFDFKKEKHRCLRSVCLFSTAINYLLSIQGAASISPSGAV